MGHAFITSFVGAIERQSAPVLVFSVDGQRALQGSVISPELEQTVRDVPEVAESGRIGQGTFTVEVDGEAVGSAGDFEVVDEIGPRTGRKARERADAPS